MIADFLNMFPSCCLATAALAVSLVAILCPLAAPLYAIWNLGRRK